MDTTLMRTLRAGYAYPPGRLEATKRDDLPVHDIGDRRLHVVAPGTADWQLPQVRAAHSSIGIDRFHANLLMSDCAQDRLHGLLSCVTWGFVSGTDFLIRPERAFGRAGSLLKGAGERKPAQPRAEIAALLQAARDAARAGDLATALRACMQLKFIGPAFATKLVMMMRPDIAGVLDSVINDRCLDHAEPELAAIHGSMLAPASTAATERFVQRYLRWCNWCARRAQELNAAGGTWPDWDGTEHPWRAVDVERAFFAMGRETAAAA